MRVTCCCCRCIEERVAHRHTCTRKDHRRRLQQRRGRAHFVSQETNGDAQSGSTQQQSRTDGGKSGWRREMDSTGVDSVSARIAPGSSTGRTVFDWFWLVFSVSVEHYYDNYEANFACEMSPFVSRVGWFVTTFAFF